MELIDRETTIKALVDEAKKIDGKRFEEPNLQHVFDFGGIIRSMPTVQAVPIEEVQEIRQEITESKYNHRGEYNRELAFNICLQIIDNHIKEIEGSDTE